MPPSPLILIPVISLMASMSSQFVNPIIAVYARDYLNATVVEIGLIVSVFSIASIISTPIIGLYCQGIRTLYAFWLGLALIAFPTIGMALVKSPIIFVVLRIFQGIGNSMFWAPGMTLVALISTKERLGRDLSNYSFVISIGMSLGPAFGSMSVATFGARISFLVPSAIMLIGFLLGIILVRHRELFRKRLNYEDAGSVSLRELPRIFSGFSFEMAFMAYVSLSFIYGILVTYGTLYFKDTFNVLDEEVAFLFFGYNLVIMFSRFSLRKLVQITSKRNILLLSLANYVAMLIIIEVSGSFLLFVGAFCLLGLSHGLIYPTGVLLIAETTETRDLAFTNSVYLMGWDLGNILGPIVAAPFTMYYGTRTALFIALLSAITVFLITLLLFGKRLRNRPNVNI